MRSHGLAQADRAIAQAAAVVGIADRVASVDQALVLFGRAGA